MEMRRTPGCTMSVFRLDGRVGDAVPRRQPRLYRGNRTLRIDPFAQTRMQRRLPAIEADRRVAGESERVGQGRTSLTGTRRGPKGFPKRAKWPAIVVPQCGQQPLLGRS